MKKLLPLLFTILFFTACEEKKLDKSPSSRFVYGMDLRKKYLDEGLDIKVNVSGDSSESLTLEYILFNDVWDRKFETEGVYQGWIDRGFKEIKITDGDDYEKVYDSTYVHVPTI